MQLSSELFSHTELRWSASDLDRTIISAHRSGVETMPHVVTRRRREEPEAEEAAA
ncbi:unnamed protein product [Eruca vesicaria subsp. sativa]|uniref:Uncharacterized protein n=1 Tax=Eruca vesicaria subsp. sativa TaxID=29727 RepID=A0ABC8JGR1_ERUVS|nr:unnamed protein product [Eruca vesicaria subsp. sativa]